MTFRGWEPEWTILSSPSLYGIPPDGGPWHIADGMGRSGNVHVVHEVVNSDYRI